MKNRYKYFLSFSVMLSTFGLFAQPPAPPATPIDGGLALLLAAGGMYGLKKLRDSKKS